jgi:hypothetical protein
MGTASGPAAYRQRFVDHRVYDSAADDGFDGLLACHVPAGGQPSTEAVTCPVQRLFYQNFAPRRRGLPKAQSAKAGRRRHTR